MVNVEEYITPKNMLLIGIPIGMGGYYLIENYLIPSFRKSLAEELAYELKKAGSIVPENAGSKQLYNGGIAYNEVTLNKLIENIERMNSAIDRINVGLEEQRKEIKELYNRIEDIQRNEPKE